MPSDGGGDASEEKCKVFAIAEHIASERIVSSMNDRRLLQSLNVFQQAIIGSQR